MKTRERSAQRSVRFLLLIVAMVLIPAAQAAASPDLTALLPEDTALMLRVRGLHDAWKRFSDSAVRDRLDQSSIPEIRQTIAQKRAEVEQFELHTGLDVEATLADILGRDFLLAVFSDGEGLFAAWNEDEDSMRFAVDTIVAIQEGEGRVVSDRIENWQGVDIRSMEIREGNWAGAPAKQRHHAIVDGILLVSKSFDVVRAAVTRSKVGGVSLADSAEFRQARQRLEEGALVAIYADTNRLGDAGLIERFRETDLRNPLFRHWHRRIRSHLAATRYFVCSVTADPAAIELQSHFVYDPAQIPPTMRDLLPASETDLDILRWLPKEHVAVLVNRVDKAALWRHSMEMLRKENPAAAEQVEAKAAQLAAAVGAVDFEENLLSRLGEQAAVVVLPGTESGVPSVCLMVEVQEGQMLAQSLRVLMTMSAMEQNRAAQNEGREPPLNVGMRTINGVTVTTLEFTGGPWAHLVSPTVFNVDRFFVLTSSAEAAQKILHAHSDGLPPLGVPGTPTTRGRLDVDLVRRLLQWHEDRLVTHSMTEEGKTRVEALQGLQMLDYILGFVRHVSFATTHTPGSVNRTCTIRLEDRSR